MKRYTMPLFAVTMFASAALLFVVQPMVAKLLLPHLGGSSAVWTTCMLFFQAVLLAGYGYAHLGARWLSPRRQALVHVPLMVAAFALLPIGLPTLGIDSSQAPIAWLLAALTLAVGLPFFVVSTSAPLLQHWFAHTGHPDADDPYHLYAASNLGSMVALLGYPFLVEPYLGARAQTVAWAALFAVFVAMTVACAWRIRDARTTRTTTTNAADAPPLMWSQRLRWTAYAFIPSSLMLGVTSYLTTDIAAVPLLWVLPLALYLFTFILVFAPRRLLLPAGFRTALPLIATAILIATAYRVPMAAGIALHLLNFWLFAMFFHGELARERPHPARLTEFFLILSIGGALGGLFNAVIAPAVFDRALDYHLVLGVAVALIAPSAWRTRNAHGNAWVIPSVLVPWMGFYLWVLEFWTLNDPVSLIPTVCFLAVVFLLCVTRPRLENVGFGVVLVVGALAFMHTDGLIAYERSFFAAYKVFEREYRESGRYIKISHGTTTHGAQSLDPAKAHIPVSYHHPDGPVGRILEAIPHQRVLVVGLGAGAMSSYAQPGMRFDIFEIDPLVEEVAREHFTYLEHCGRRCDVTIGDGRNLIAAAPDHTWDIIFLDAYNSDAVPTHLLTLEALELYARKIKPGGVIVFHVSNRYLDIEGVVGAVARAAGVTARTMLHIPPRRQRRRKHIDASKYTIVARSAADLGRLNHDEAWTAARTADVVWTDDFTNVLSVFEWE